MVNCRMNFISLYDEMEGVSLSGKKAAAFGPGDSSYDMFCEAVNLIEKRLKECGADVIAPSLKVDGDIEAAEDQARQWGKHLAAVRSV